MTNITWNFVLTTTPSRNHPTSTPIRGTQQCNGRNPSILYDGHVQHIQTHTNAIVEDIRPFSFTEGSGMKKFAKSLIRVGTILEVMPGDDVIEKLIPFRKACTTALRKRYNKDEQALKDHFKRLNQEILLAFNLSFDLWTDRGKKHHYLCLMAHEVNKETKQMEVYCLEMIDWEELELDMFVIEEAIEQEQAYTYDGAYTYIGSTKRN
eukprot:1017671_1